MHSSTTAYHNRKHYSAHNHRSNQNQHQHRRRQHRRNATTDALQEEERGRTRRGDDSSSSSENVFIDAAVRSGHDDSDSKRVSLREILGQGQYPGPPRFFSPLIDDRKTHAMSSMGTEADFVVDVKKPLMVYLPGLDGTGFSASAQFKTISYEFDLICLNIPSADRSDADQIVDYVSTYLRKVKEEDPGREIQLIGESMGGAISLYTCIKYPELVSKATVINPASSFDKSVWPLLGPLLPQIPEELYGGLPFALAPVLIDPIRLATEAVEFGNINETLEKMVKLLPALGALATIIPRDTLKHRLQILADACKYINENDGEKLKNIKVPILVVASTNDLLIPSNEEAPRLQKLIGTKKCKVEILEGRSHAALQEKGIDIVKIMKRHDWISLKSKNDDRRLSRDETFTPPSAAQIEKALDGLRFLRSVHSPVFFSTRERDGRVMQGIDQVPTWRSTNRPVLLVGNHQTVAPDLGFLVAEFLKEKNVCVRGLAHPVVSRDNGTMMVGSSMEDDDEEMSIFEKQLRETAQNTPFAQFLPESREEKRRQRRAGTPNGGPFGGGSFSDFGAVPVSGKNFYKLLKANETVLLFPGGVREAFKRKNEKYQLFWPSKPEFVKMAIRFNAIIVPFSAIGAEDSFDIVMDAEEMLSNPLLGERVRTQMEKVPSARKFDTRETDDDMKPETFIQPILAPTTPERFYFRFMKPIDTIGMDRNNEEEVKRVYKETKMSVESGIAYLKAKREQDPFKNVGQRVLYEAATKKTAPTFSLLL
jgi:pimeloyl-ACP methyl ester carboxylesterase